MYPNIKLIDYKIKEQIKDIFPMLIRSIFMFISVFGIQFLYLSPVVTLLIQIPTGVIIYLLISILVKDKNIPYLIELTGSFIKKKNCCENNILQGNMKGIKKVVCNGFFKYKR